MDTRGRKGKKAPRKRAKKPRDNVTYLAELTNDNTFASPRGMLEHMLDDFRFGRNTHKKIMILTVGDDFMINYNQCGFAAPDFAIVGARLQSIGMGLFDDDED